MVDNPFYSHEFHGDYDLVSIGRLDLEEGTARTFVLPIDEDMFFPVRDCRAEQELVPGSELRVPTDLAEHLALFGVAPTWLPQVDRHLGELLAS